MSSHPDTHVAAGHKHAPTSEQAARKALSSLHGWDRNAPGPAAKGKIKGKPASTPAKKLRKSPTKIDKDHYPLSPAMMGDRKVAACKQMPVALSAGTRLNVWWSGEEEPFECTVAEWRLISAEQSDQAAVYIHRCEYEGGSIDHDLTQIVFEIVPGTLDDAQQVAETLPPPTSPLKANVLSRGHTAVWEAPAAPAKAADDVNDAIAHQKL